MIYFENKMIPENALIWQIKGGEVLAVKAKDHAEDINKFPGRYLLYDNDIMSLIDQIKNETIKIRKENPFFGRSLHEIDSILSAFYLSQVKKLDSTPTICQYHSVGTFRVRDGYIAPDAKVWWLSDRGPELVIAKNDAENIKEFPELYSVCRPTYNDLTTCIQSYLDELKKSGAFRNRLIEIEFLLVLFFLAKNEKP
jgi:hypothetical protein